MSLRYLPIVLLLFFIGCSSTKETIPVAGIEFPAELNVITRAQWGSLELSKALPEHEITKITIHHGGVDFAEDKDPVGYIKNLQIWSMSDEKKWIDIPYHYMIDLEGRIYEARPINYPGATNTTYDPTGHALICVMGNYENQILSEGQLDAVVNLSAFLASYFSVPSSEIKGHMDYAETQCPGKDLYKYLQDNTIQNRVSEKLLLP